MPDESVDHRSAAATIPSGRRAKGAGRHLSWVKPGTALAADKQPPGPAMAAGTAPH